MNKKAFKKDIKDIVKTMTFVEALEKGIVEENDFEDFINEWNENQNGKNVAEYLGMTEEQYFEFLKNHISSLKFFNN